MTTAQFPEVADIIRRYEDDFLLRYTPSPQQAKVMRHIGICRTAELGGHIAQCSHCRHERIAYNSCRDRHCPKCQTMVKEKWLNDRRSELLPCGYFHSVFTIAHELNAIILCNKRVCLGLLFATVKETLTAFAQDPQWRHLGMLGWIAVLHTWNQELLDHFHLHCLIPAGVLSFDKKKWKPARKGKKYLFKNDSVAKEFKKRYLAGLQKFNIEGKLIFPGKTQKYEDKKAFAALLQKAGRKKWVTYAKRPFASPEQVLEYLGRYTHRVAITNNRIQSMENAEVVFTYRDRRDNDVIKERQVGATEFIRRFLLHVLPKGFMKIRYYGFLAHTNKGWSIPLLRKLINPELKLPEKLTETIEEMMFRLTGIDITLCPSCGIGKMVVVNELPVAKRDTS